MIQCTVQFRQWTNHNPRGEVRHTVHWQLHNVISLINNKNTEESRNTRTRT